MPNRPGARSRSSVGRRGSKVHGEVRLPRLRLPHKGRLARGDRGGEPRPANEHDRWVASMGHGSFDTTMKYYTGVPADHQKQAAEALGEPLFVVSNGPAEDATPVKPRTVGRTEDGVAVETPAKRRFM
jgi:hypothetical protein